MASTTTPFDPFWKYILDEDSDGEQPAPRRQRVYSRGKSSESGSLNKVRFSFSRPGIPKDVEDDVSIMDLASMDLRPNIQEEKRSRWRLSREPLVENRDDDDDIFGCFMLPCADQNNSSQKGTSGQKSVSHEASLFSMIGLSPCQSVEKIQSKGMSKQRDRRRPIISDDNETSQDSSFLEVLGISSSKSSKERDTLPLGQRKNGSSIQDSQNKPDERNISFLDLIGLGQASEDDGGLEISRKSSKRRSFREEASSNFGQEESSSNITFTSLLGIPTTQPYVNPDKKSEQVSSEALHVQQSSSVKSKVEKIKSEKEKTKEDARFGVILDSKNSSENIKSDKSVNSASLIKIGQSAKNEKATESEAYALKKNTSSFSQRLGIGAAKEPIFPDVVDEASGTLSFFASQTSSSSPNTNSNTNIHEPKQTLEKSSKSAIFFPESSSVRNPPSGSTESVTVTRKAQKFPKQPFVRKLSDKTGEEKVVKEASKDKRLVKSKTLSTGKHQSIFNVMQRTETNKTPKINDGVILKESDKLRTTESHPAKQRHAAVMKWRRKRMQKQGSNPGSTSEKVTNPQVPISFPGTTALAAVGVAAIGIAAAGVAATGELFDGKDLKKTENQRDVKKNMSMLDYLDVFNSSDEESLHLSDGEEFYSAKRRLSTASHYSSGSEWSTGPEEEESPIKEVIFDNDLGFANTRTPSWSERSSKSISKYSQSSVQDNEANHHLGVKSESTSRVCDVEGPDASKHDNNAEPQLSKKTSRKGLGKISFWGSSALTSGGRNAGVATVDRSNKIDHELCEGNAKIPVASRVTIISSDESEKDRMTGIEIIEGKDPKDIAAPERKPQTFYTYEHDPTAYIDVQYRRYGSRNEIYIHNRLPESFRKLEKGEVIINVEASTISFTDCRIRRGEWQEERPLDLPLIPGVDFVGKVDMIGKQTASRTGLRNGDRVISLVKHGGNARYTKLRADQLVKVPDGVCPPQAACLAEAYLSAFQAIHCGQPLITRYTDTALAGKLILVLGILTNVGRAAVELAVAAGARLVYAPCKDKHQASVQALGAIPLCVSRDEVLARMNRKVDLIVDATADIKREFDNYFNALNEEGDYLLIGKRSDTLDVTLSNWIASTKPSFVCGNGKLRMSNQVHAYDVFETWDSNLEVCKRDLAHLLTLLQRGGITPRVLDRVSLDKVAKAHGVLDERRVQGFIVCEPWIKGMSREGPLRQEFVQHKQSVLPESKFEL